MNPSQAQREFEEAVEAVNRAVGMTPEQVEKLKGQVLDVMSLLPGLPNAQAKRSS